MADRREMVVPDGSAPAFLAGGGEMGRFIRACDWAATPLGDAKYWPQPLKAAVRLMLNTQHPMYIWWGPDLLCFYNDAYRPSIGDDRHPNSIGRPAREVWAEIWPLIGPQVEQVLRGEGGVWAVDALVPITRNGRREDVYWTYSYSPIHEDGAPAGVGGVLVICNETTELIHAYRRRDALAKLEDLLRDTTDPAHISFVASKMLGEALGAVRAGYGVLDAERQAIILERAWTAGGYADVEGTYAFADYGSYVGELLAGQPVVNVDVARDARTAAHAASFTALGIGAHIDMPIVEDRSAVAEMFVHHAEPRCWTDEEIAFVGEVARRTRASITRRKAEQALYASEERFRLLAETITEVFYVLNLDAHTIEYVSPAYEGVWQQPASALLADPTSYWASIHPDDRQIAIDAFARQPSGENTDIRYRLLRGDGSIRHIHDRAYVTDRASDGTRRVVGLAEDVTATTSMRLELRQALDDKELLMREVDHRVSNSLAMIGSLLSLQRAQARGDEARAALDGAAARVIAIARIHDRLHKSRVTGIVEFGDYLGALCADIERTIGGNRRAIDLSVEPVELPVEFAVPLGIIANELITNAFKHGDKAAPARVSITLRRGDVLLTFEVGNAGQMSADFRPGNWSGLGLRVIGALAKQIGGTIGYPSAGGAAVFKLSVPLETLGQQSH